MVATASTEEKRQFCLEHGAEEAYGYDEFAEAVKPDSSRSRRWRGVRDECRHPVAAGHVVGIGYAGGWWEELNPALLVGRNVGIQGFYLGRLMSRRPDVVVTAAGELLEVWSTGAIKPVVGAEYPLAEAADAHRLIEERKHVGKVVLVP